MKSLPSGWAKTALGEIADVQLGKMLDQAKNIGKPYLYLRNVNVRWGKFDLTDVQSMKITSDEVALFNVQNGDVFVCEGGEPGRCAVWNHGTNEFTYQKALHRVRFHGELNPKLFAWKMFLDAQSQKLTNYFTGSTIKHFPKTEIVKYPVLIPPLKEQTRIADKLDTVLTRVDACRDRLARVAPLLKRFRQSVLAAATSGRLTEDWRTAGANSWRKIRLGELGELGRGKSKHRPRNDLRLYGGAYPFIQTGDVANSNGCIERHSQTYSEFGLLQSKLWPADTLCITIAANIADTAVLSYPACFPDSVVGFIPDQSLCKVKYIKWSIDVLKDDIERLAPATAQKNINLGILDDVQINLPSVEEQAEIIRRVETLFAFADRLEARLKTAQTAADRLTPALLAKAFRGELVPQDPNDEPAAELLKRLAASRDAAPKAKRGRRSATADTTP